MQTLESDSVQVVKDNFFQLFVNFLLLSKDDVAFTLNSSSIQLGVLQNVANNIDRGRDVLPKAFRVVNGLLPRSVGVQVGSEVFDLEL